MNPVYNKICMGLGITLGFFPGVGFGAQIPKPWLGEDATYAAIATSSAAVTEGQASKDSRFLLDLASIAEINGVAQTLWKQMAACQMGAPLGIRQAYLENKWSCKNPEKKNLVNSIFAFHEEVQAFLRTSLFLEGDYFRIFQKETVADLSLKLHPLTGICFECSLNLIAQSGACGLPERFPCPIPGRVPSVISIRGKLT